MITVKNHVPSINFVTVEHIKEPERYLIDAKEVLESLNLRWSLAFGTALGFYRDKDFIPLDTDVDVVVLADDKTPVRGIVEALEGRYKLIREVFDGDKCMQTAFQGEDGYILDIIYLYRDGDKLYSHAEGGTYVDKYENLAFLRYYDTKYGIFPLPGKIEEYLTDRYGDWKTPKHGAITSSNKI